MKKKNLVVGLSGGETSGYMTQMLINNDLPEYESISFIFANTSCEREETLVFVERMSQHFNINVVWVEAVIHHNKRKGSTYKIVDFKSAKRNGEVFEDMIDKYGIPNISYIHCTRELKNNPIKAWCIDNFGKNYEIAVGIRLDERERETKKSPYQLVYPLIEGGMTKDDVMGYWGSQPFRLEIENYEGNCSFCYKKSLNKLKIIARENPHVFDFPARMEATKGLCGNNVDGTHRVFFTGNKSAKDIITEANDPDFDYLKAREKVIKDYKEALNEGGCSEECKPFS